MVAVRVGVRVLVAVRVGVSDGDGVAVGKLTAGVQPETTINGSSKSAPNSSMRLTLSRAASGLCSAPIGIHA